MVHETQTPATAADSPMLRIDSAHPMQTRPAAGNEAASSAEAAVLASPLSAQAAEQLHVQAAQLSQHLQERRWEVDHREAQLNARIAQLESDLRVSRLWLREKSEDFAQREEELATRLAEQESRLRELATTELNLEGSQQQLLKELQTREATVERREALLAQGQAQLAQEVERLRVAREQFEQHQLNEQAQLDYTRQELNQDRITLADERDQFLKDAEEGRQELRRMAAELDQRQPLPGPPGEGAGSSQLAERERRLAVGEASLEEQLRQLHKDREEHYRRVTDANHDLATMRKSLVEQQQQLDERQDQQQQVWEARQEQLDERQVALDRMRADILRLHREALEMRLIGEQLWLQVQPRMPAHTLTESMSRLRSQLADEYRLAKQELSSERVTLEKLIASLDEKRSAVTTQRQELVEWFARRQKELARQAAEMAHREQGLEREKRMWEEQRQRWQAERRELQRRVRELAAAARGELVAA